MQILVGVLLTGLITLNIGCLKNSARISERLVSVETKVDIYLDHTGFDLRKVNRAIRQHEEDLKGNNNTSVGCIDITKLYKEG